MTRLALLLITLCCTLGCTLCCSTCIGAADAPLAANAPSDKPVRGDDQQLARMKLAIAPYVEQALASYPAAKERFLEGLAVGESFFVTIRLVDEQRREEQVFLLVTGIADSTITGLIYSHIGLVSGYTFEQEHQVAEADILDWLIAKPDGSEEGNVVGKFLDTYQP